MNEHALFLVQNTYPANGHQYWHGFVQREDAADFMKKFAALEIANSMYFGAVTLNAKQLVESRRPSGCVVNPEQMSKTLKEV